MPQLRASADADLEQLHITPTPPNRHVNRPKHETHTHTRTTTQITPVDNKSRRECRAFCRPSAHCIDLLKPAHRLERRVVTPRRAPYWLAHAGAQTRTPGRWPLGARRTDSLTPAPRSAVEPGRCKAETRAHAHMKHEAQLKPTQRNKTQPKQLKRIKQTKPKQPKQPNQLKQTQLQRLKQPILKHPQPMQTQLKQPKICNNSNKHNASNSNPHSSNNRDSNKHNSNKHNPTTRNNSNNTNDSNNPNKPINQNNSSNSKTPKHLK